MKAKKILLSLLAATLFIPSVALADRGHRGRDRDRQHRQYREHRHDRFCDHDHRRGRYELRTVTRWVDGYYDQQWVPGRCWEERRGRFGQRVKTVCSEGRYESRWIDGHYQHVQKWVWVPRGSRYRS